MTLNLATNDSQGLCEAVDEGIAVGPYVEEEKEKNTHDGRAYGVKRSLPSDLAEYTVTG